jgi:hypothetical protein
MVLQGHTHNQKKQPHKEDKHNMTTFVDIIDRQTTLIIDGYSSAKTINGVMHDIAKIMKKVLPNEYDTFMTKNKEEAENLLDCTPEGSKGGFFIQVEDVSCASWSDFLEAMDGGIELQKISVPDSMVIREFADKIGVRQAEIIRWLFLRGKVASCKSPIGFNDMKEFAEKYGFICEGEGVSENE